MRLSTSRAITREARISRPRGTVDREGARRASRRLGGRFGGAEGGAKAIFGPIQVRRSFVGQKAYGPVAPPLVAYTALCHRRSTRSSEEGGCAPMKEENETV